MLKIPLIIGLIFVVNLEAQNIDFNKMKEIYEARQPLLDSMINYPSHNYKSLFTINKNNHKISFWWIPNKQKVGTVVLIHGFMMNKSHMLERADLYYNLGKNVILIDLRARGESQGDKTTSGVDIKEDVKAVIKYYNQNLNPYGKLILQGYSHGGRAAIFALSDLLSNVEGLVLESTPYSLEESFKRTFNVKEVPDMNSGSLDEALIKISNLPILLLYGSNDTAIIKDEAHKIASNFKNSKSRVIEFEDARHDLTEKKHIEQLKTVITRFIKLNN